MGTHRGCGLTVKLSGRTEAPGQRPGRTLSPGARGAKPLTHHGPLQRLLDGDGSIIGEVNPGYHSPFGQVAGALVDLTKEAKVNADVSRLKVVGAVFSAENGRHTIRVELPLDHGPA